MQNNENKTKEELIKIIEQLEKKVEDLSSMQSYPVQERFREKYSTRILDALPDMLTVFDHDANIIELASSPSTNHVEGINADNITHSNVKDILPPEAYESVRQNMDRVILTGESSTSRHDLMLDGILHHYENRIFPLDNEYLLCMCRDISEQWNAEQTNKKQQKELEAARIKAEESDRLKSAFLANMSHEIRTPMNAVIGMAQMALREELPSNARTYINQIISSGKTLLTIINDVLDFSKIESGKMDIEETEYEPMSVINDVSNMIMTRVMDKDVELILDIAPDLPRKLYGDSNRIKQIMINIANNAVKFTKEGQVVLKVGFECIGEEEILLLISVSDTGIGIKKEDMERLFESFQQVDSKRNRNIEGTGLGLAICKKLLEFMNGKIWVESEFGKGSTFSVCIPQRVLDTRPSVIIRDNEMILATGLIKNVFVKQQMEKDMKKLRIHYQTLDTEEYLDKAAGAQFLFVEKALYTEKVRHFIEIHPDLDAVMLIDFSDSVRSDYGNLIVIKKPLYVLNLAGIFNHEDISVNADISESVFDFTAPEAQILIVDDNPVNLTVTEGLLKPLEMKIDTAAGGEEAVEMISKKKYDLIFMDHMMPELDGVETTHIIRRFHKEYDSVPIIALTANAVDGVKEMFLNEGMNDFVAKPIEMSRILAKLQKWLPQEKIYKVRNKMAQEETTKMKIEGLNTGRALQFLGSEKLYWSVLKDYYYMIDKKADLIKTLEEKEDWKRYMIEVHALKSISKQIGAEELSKLAAEMEQAGNRGDAGVIHRRTDDMLAFYRSYREILRPYFPEEKESAGEKKMDAEVLRTFFSEMRNAMDELDMDSMDELVKKMKAYRYEGIQEEYFKAGGRRV